MKLRIYWAYGGHTDSDFSRFGQLDAWLRDMKNVARIDQLDDAGNPVIDTSRCCHNPNPQTFGPNGYLAGPTVVCTNCGRLYDEKGNPKPSNIWQPVTDGVGQGLDMDSTHKRGGMVSTAATEPEPRKHPDVMTEALKRLLPGASLSRVVYEPLRAGHIEIKKGDLLVGNPDGSISKAQEAEPEPTHECGGMIDLYCNCPRCR